MASRYGSQREPAGTLEATPNGGDRWWLAGTGSWYLVLTLILLAPMFGPGSPPGVDAPTFLHLAWVSDLALTGGLEQPLTDPYWYGGWPYAAAYPPLAYGVVGVMSAVTPIPIEIAYRIVLVLAVAGVGFSTLLLGRELGLSRWLAASAGVLVLLMYPLLAGAGMWGWLASLVALPLAVGSAAALERAVRTGHTWPAVTGGSLMGLSLLAHHMTAFAFAIGLLGWAAYHLASDAPNRRRIMGSLAIAGLTGTAISGLWIAFFLVHILGVGFEREVPGNWAVSVGTALRAAVDRSLISVPVYPSYLGIVQVPLAIGGAAYALTSARRFGAAAVMLAVFTWFALGDDVMPLIRIYPFSGLDVARFALFMAPFMAVLAVLFAEALGREIHRSGYLRLRSSNAVRAAALAGMVLVLIAPAVDAASARGLMVPLRAPGGVDDVLVWLEENLGAGERVIGLGFGTWGSWVIPEQTGLPIMDGWNDEGADAWRPIREVRLMGWLPYFGQAEDVDVGRLHEVMRERNTSHVVVLQWAPQDSPQLWELALQSRHDLFLLRAAWPGVTVYELMGSE